MADDLKKQLADMEARLTRNFRANMGAELDAKLRPLMADIGIAREMKNDREMTLAKEAEWKRRRDATR